MTKAALRKIGYLLVIVDASIELRGIGHYLRKRYLASLGEFSGLRFYCCDCRQQERTRLKSIFS
jgi:hypothetical protein